MANKKNENHVLKKTKKTKKKQFKNLVGKNKKKKVSIENINFNQDCSASTKADENLDKVTANRELINEIKTENITLDLVDMVAISQMIKLNANCSHCKLRRSLGIKSIPRVGLACNFVLNCSSCGDLAKTSNSTRRSYISGGRTFLMESINFAVITAARISGFGREATKRFFAFVGLRNPPDNWVQHQTLLREAFKKRAEESMKQAAEELKQDASKRGLDGASASFDGSWMKRGMVSLIGFVSCIGMYTNKIIGIDVRCKYCPVCHGKATENFPCRLGVDCGINHHASSGAMEPEGAVNIIKTLAEKNNLQITEYLGDGDSKAYALVNKTFNWTITKLECVNHVAKRMGARLLNRKKTVKGLGGSRGTLTIEACKKIQSYYHTILTGSNGDVPLMQKRIEAMYRHISSSDDRPDHDLCDEVCKYLKEMKQRAEEKAQGSKKKRLKKQAPPMNYRHQHPHFHVLASQMEK